MKTKDVVARIDAVLVLAADNDKMSPYDKTLYLFACKALKAFVKEHEDHDTCVNICNEFVSDMIRFVDTTGAMS
jgi:hypothetical protein